MRADYQVQPMEDMNVVLSKSPEKASEAGTDEVVNGIVTEEVGGNLNFQNKACEMCIDGIGEKSASTAAGNQANADSVEGSQVSEFEGGKVACHRNRSNHLSPAPPVLDMKTVRGGNKLKKWKKKTRKDEKEGHWNGGSMAG